MITFAVLLGTANIKTKNKKLGQNFFQKRLEYLGKGFMTIPLPNGKTINLGLTKDAIAEESGCDAILEEIDGGAPQYTAGSLSYFNGVLYVLNNRVAADVENVFCHFVNTMEMDGEDGEKTVEIEEENGSMYVKVTVSSSGLEAWATSAQYSKKAVVEVSENNTDFITYMTMWWGFAEGSTSTITTRGLLYEGSPKTLGGTRASLMKWDLTTANQTGQFLTTEFMSADSESDISNITPEAYYLSTSRHENDRAMYGRFKLNTETNEVHVQGISIEGERKQGEAPGAYGCFKIYGVGVKGDMMVIAKSRDGRYDSDTTFGFLHGSGFTGGTTGSAAQAKDISDMDAACLVDKTTTENMKGNIGTQPRGYSFRLGGCY